MPRTLRLAKARSSLQIRTRPGSRNVLFIECAAKAKDVRASVKFDLAPHSALTAVFLWKGKGAATITQQSTVAAGAALHLLNVTEGSAEQSFTGEVTGKGGECTLDWIAHTKGSDRCVLSARTIFAARDGRGTTTLHGVAEGRSQMRALGSIEIPQSGSDTHARLEQRILLLDPGARAEAVPELKIEIDDVQVSHAATVSRIHPEDLFYLQSRGITAKKARTLLIRGFLDELLDGLPLDFPREQLRA